MSNCTMSNVLSTFNSLSLSLVSIRTMGIFLLEETNIKIITNHNFTPNKTFAVFAIYLTSLLSLSMELNSQLMHKSTTNNQEPIFQHLFSFCITFLICLLSLKILLCILLRLTSAHKNLSLFSASFIIWFCNKGNLVLSTSQ